MIEILTDVWILTRENPVTMGVMLGSAGFILTTATVLLMRRLRQ